MVNQWHNAYKAADRSYFSILKKDIHAEAASAGFSSTKLGEIDLIISEMVSNLAKHAVDGQLWVRLVEERGVQGIEIFSVDSGPGMVDVSKMVADGVSTTNTLGHGLGSIKRLSDVFQIFSVRGWGTVMLSRIFNSPLPYQKPNWNFNARSLLIPKPGEVMCGDGFYCVSDQHYVKLMLGDGLGHGPEAAEAVIRAGKAFVSSNITDPVDMLRHLHQNVRKTRGLVGTVAVFDVRSRAWQICGVGNISCRLIGSGFVKQYMSYNGIIGLNLPNTMNVQEVSYEQAQQLILCSDGLKTKWELTKYPGLLRYDPSMMLAVLMKDHARLTDDMSVATCKINL